MGVSPGTSSLVKEYHDKNDSTDINVITTTLDEYMREHKQNGNKMIDLIKLDIEFHESAMLTGAKSIIKQYKKTHPTHDQSHITGKDACPYCPAMGIDWENANKHCRAVGKFLPTESEWNLAAGSLLKKVAFLSVKNTRPIANLSGEKDGFISVAPVGSFPSGAGPYGTLDMIGNVWEWVDTPIAPTSANSKLKKNKALRVIKGGGWSSPAVFSTEGYRNVVDGDIKNPTFGFRCAKPIN